MATLTVEYFKKNYASLKDVGDEELKGVLEKLNRNWVKNSDQLAAITRDTLIRNEFPGLFVDAVKPAEGKFGIVVPLSCFVQFVCSPVTLKCLY